MRASWLWVGLLIAPGTGAWAASLDVTAAYQMHALSYTNLNLDSTNRNDHSFISNDARLGVAVHKIPLETRGGEDVSMDVGILLRALGVAGSTVAVSAPFNRAAGNYPSSDLTPFIENAYLRVHQLFGVPLEATFGRQTFRLGSGLLLDDDGAGLTGVSAQGSLPWGGLKVEGFIFEDKSSLNAAPNTLDLFGLDLAVPTEGIWHFSQLFERDRAIQPIYGCQVDPVNQPGVGCFVSKALRSFSSAHYQLNYGPMVFDGEAAMEKGAATPTGPIPSGNHITYNGDAEVVRAKWKQRLYKTGEGIARLSVARGSGDKAGTSTTDEAFFPSHGHRYDGLERSGFGDFFGATPYDAFGGSYSSATASGLKQGTSGIVVFGMGYTPPAYNGVALDVDYYLFQADRVVSGSRSLGSEWDIRLRYAIIDHFTMSFSAAMFKAGLASNPVGGNAKKLSFQVSGRF